MSRDKLKKHNLVYKLTLIQDPLKYYIGKHSTNLDPSEDPYRGSGREVRKIQEIYGNDCFTIEYLSDWSTVSEAYAEEARRVGDLWKTDPNCLNCGPGGHTARDNSGLVVVSKGEVTRFVDPESVSKFLEAGWRRGVTERARLKAAAAVKGRKFSEEHKKKISIANSGKIFIFFEQKFIRVNPEELQSYLDKGAVQKTPHDGLECSEETKKKISERRKGHVAARFLDGTVHSVTSEEFRKLKAEGKAVGIKQGIAPKRWQNRNK